MQIKCNVLDRQYQMYQPEYDEAALRVLRSGWYVLGNEVGLFEEEFAKFTGRKYCVGLNSGLDALIMSVRALGIGRGDEVIVQANTYIASVMGITINGALPVFVEPDEYYNIDADRIEGKITSKTKAILVVHLYGQASNMKPIVELAEKYGLWLVEDCAQSHGACVDGQMTGTFGDIGCFSFYPSKNLGAFGDAGAIVTNDPKIAEDVKIIRNYGSEKRYYNKVVGANSRLDEIQAGLLQVKLRHLKELQDERASICDKYLKAIHNTHLILPRVRESSTTVWHQFVIRSNKRSELIDYLDKNGIGTIVHYPIPPHLSEAYAYLGYRKGSYPITETYANEVLSIPLYNGMTEEEIDKVVKCLNQWET